MSNVPCEVCGRPHAQIHHIIHRSAAKYLTNVKINFKYLCLEHHNGGDNSPHRNYEVDKKYKIEYQQKVENLFTNPFYTEAEVIKILKVSRSSADKILKTLVLHKEGYSREDIILRLLGGRYYV